MPDDADDDSVGDIWDYAHASDVIPLSSSDSEDPGTEAGHSLRARRDAPRVHEAPIVLNSSSSSSSSSEDEVAPPPQKAKPAFDVTDVADYFIPLPPPRVRRKAEVEDRATQVLQANRVAMERLRAASREAVASNATSGESGGERSDAESLPAVVEDGESCKIRLNCKSAAFPQTTIRLRKDDPLRKLMSTYRREAEGKGWLQPGGKLAFRFDGDIINEDDTATGLDMDENDVIDVTYV